MLDAKQKFVTVTISIMFGIETAKSSSLFKCNHLKMEGGIDMPTMKTLRACKNVFWNAKNSVGVDWIQQGSSCYFHDTKEPLKRNLSSVHYTLTPCPGQKKKVYKGKTVTSVSNQGTSLYKCNHLKMEGGFGMPTMKQEGACKDFCLNAVNCAGVDWIQQGPACYFHATKQPLKRNLSSVHYTLTACPGRKKNSNKETTVVSFHGVLQCKRLCVSHVRCMAIVYKQSHLICRLLMMTSGLKKRDGLLIPMKTHFPIQCQHMYSTCRSGQICLRSKKGEYMCRDDL